LPQPIALTIAVVAGVVTTVGIMLFSGSSKSDASGPDSAERGPIRLSFSSPWKRSPVAGSFSYGLQLAVAVRLERAYAGLWAGRVVGGAAVPGGLPPEFERNLHGTPARRQVQLHEVPAMRYSGVVDPGARRFTLYVVAGEESDYAFLCTGATRRDVNRCETVIQRSRLEGVSAIPPGADIDLTRQLHRLINPLYESSELIAELSNSASSLQVAKSAEQLQRVYRRAGRSLATLPTQPRNRPAVVALANALAAEAGDLGQLATSATSADADYGSAAVAVEFSSRAVRGSLRRLRRIGFASLPLLPLLSVSPHLIPGSVPNAPDELVNEPRPEEGDGPPETHTEAEAGRGWETEDREEESEAESGFEDGGTGRAPEPKTEPATPVEEKGAR
jgi:hypothetical protein